MDKKVQDRPTFLDTVKLLGAAGILIAAIAFFYVFPDVSVLIRAFTMLVAALVAGFVALQSFRGQAFWKFVQPGARILKSDFVARGRLAI